MTSALYLEHYLDGMHKNICCCCDCVLYIFFRFVLSALGERIDIKKKQTHKQCIEILYEHFYVFYVVSHHFNFMCYTFYFKVWNICQMNCNVILR